MAGLPPTPPSLKAINIYLKTAIEHDKRDPVVAYYCRLYAVQRGMEIDRKSPDSKAFLMKLMDVLDSAKASLKDNESISSETVGQAHLENYALKLFANADTRDRNSDFGPVTVKSFYTAGLLMDVVGVFGEISEEIKNVRKYAKWKSIYITNCKKNGEDPIPGPIDAEGVPVAPDMDALGAMGGGGPSSSHIPPSVSINPPAGPSSYTSDPPHHEYKTPAAPASTPVSGPTSVATPTAHLAAPATGSVQLQVQDYNKGMQYCKYASSALQYQDAKTAIEYLQKALTLLTTGVDQ